MIMCPIAHVPHWPCAPSPMCPTPQGTPSLSLILTLIPYCPCPIAHVSCCPCAPSPMCPIPQGTPSLSLILTMIPYCPCPIAHVSCCPCAPSPMCPITHVPHHPCAPSSMCPIPQGAPSLSSVLTMIPICPCVPLPTCQKICQFIKQMSSCQKDVKLSKRCQMSKSQTHGLWRRFTKKIN